MLNREYIYLKLIFPAPVSETKGATMFNILDDPVIGVKRNIGAIDKLTLPQVYAALVADDIAAFPALRPHQKHALHAFLVQLGVIAMHNAGLTEPPTDTDEWRRVIRDLTPEFPNDEPWRLVVEDITKPAFMQPPASSKEREKDYKSIITTPDELDMLVTAKNHDLKASIGTQGNTDDWLYALITPQTMDGNPGRNPGIARMNGAFGNRPAFSLAPIGGVGAHVRRDMKALSEQMPELNRKRPMNEDGIGLLWTQKWDGTRAESLTLDKLHPLFIEICRLVRLRDDNGLYAIKATAKSNRIEAKAMKGMMGDPWTPINQKENKSLTLAKGGFTYKRIAVYLRDWEHPALLKQTREERRSSDNMALVARAMVRGQGKTEGYYERFVTLRPRTLSRLNTQELGTIAKGRIYDVQKVQSILRHAVSVFAAGGGDSIADEHRSRANPWANKLDGIVDATFFDDLQDEFEADASERQAIRNKWLRNDEDKNGVINHARKILHDAEDSLPCNEIRRYKARTRAEGVFEGMIRSGSRGFPDLFQADTKEG